ncbi:MAG: class II aldolase/adducin family protein [Spirochaetia bacterium]|nr:class II aldolase/adducin family protein [Spirochaetia bacterium]
MDLTPFQSIREEVAAIMRRLYSTRLTTTSGGNISFRLNDELFAITPSQYDKSSLTADVIAVVGFDNTNYTPHLPLSIESEMHRTVLLARKDINAVVHAHPVYASSFTAMKKPINTKLLAESWFLLEEPAFAPYQRMGTPALATSVVECVAHSNVVLMENHGVLTVGKTLVSAFDLIEVLENSAKMTFITQMMALSSYEVSPLNEEKCEELMRMKKGN